MKFSLRPHVPALLLTITSLACSNPPPEPSQPASGTTSPDNAQSSTAGPPPPSSSVKYTVVDESVSDTPAKTQIAQHVLASGIPTRDELHAELLMRYQAALGRRGFQYHNPATNIFIYIYGTEEQARSRQGLWIGMVGKGYSDTGPPQPMISEDRLAALSAQPEERFGLSEGRRREAFRAIVAAETRGTNDAMAQVPDSEIMKQIALERDLQAKYKRAVAREYRLTDDQLQQVAVEGIKNGWPR